MWKTGLTHRMQHSQDQLVAQLHAPRVFFLEDAENKENSHIGENDFKQPTQKKYGRGYIPTAG